MAPVRTPSPSEMAGVAEAAAALSFASIVRRTLAARRWQSFLGATVPVTADAVPAGAATGTEGDVSRAVSRAVRRLPWHVTCLDQALAAQLMLRRRGQPGTAVIGLRPGDGRAQGAWPAHAWLVGATGTVVGLEAGAGYTPVSGFRPPGPGRS